MSAFICMTIHPFGSSYNFFQNDFDLLKWWKVKEATWPALSKMAKQYLAAPASSAGVERVFSAAGKMHSDLRKSMSDDSLKHSLFAAFNTK